MKPSFLIRMVRNKKKRENIEHFAAKTLRFNIDEIKDINYAGDSTEYHTLDVYSPQNSKEILPVIVMIHGGGYISCDKSINELQGKYFAEKGFRVVNINYSLQPEADFIEGVQDIFRVLDWIKDKSEEFHFDKSRIFIYGDSAGGHYALLALAVQNSEYLQAYYKINPFCEGIKGVAVSCPMYEIKSAKEKKDITNRFLKMCTLHSGRINNDEYINNVSFPEVLEHCRFPEIMLITTPTDSLLYKEARRFHEILKDRNIKHIYKEYSSHERVLEHVFHAVNPEYPESQQANDDIVGYFS